MEFPELTDEAAGADLDQQLDEFVSQIDGGYVGTLSISKGSDGAPVVSLDGALTLNQVLRVAMFMATLPTE